MAKIIVTEPGSIVMVGNGDTVIIDIPGGGDVTIIADPADTNIQTFRIEFRNDSQADNVKIMLPTFNSDDLHIDIKDYDPSDTVALVGSYDTYVEPNNTDEYQFSYTGADGQEHVGFVRAKDKDEKDFTADPSPIIICFAAGTLIDTNRGRVPVEDLREWDCAHTVDNGLQPIRWIGHRHLGAAELAAAPHLRPIHVARGALGRDRPDRPLVLSPNHRVLVSGWRVETMFGEAEVLVPIKSLINGDTIRVDTDATEVDYYHVLLSEHELLYANGLVAESLFMGDQSAKAIAQTAIEQDAGVLGEVINTLIQAPPDMARPALRAAEAKLLSAA